MKYLVTLFIILATFACGDVQNIDDSPYVEECMTAYNQDVLSPTSNQLLVFNVAVTVFVYEGDTIQEADLNEMFWSLNNLYQQAGISFNFDYFNVIENDRIADNMESYREHAKLHSVPNAINCFVYPSSKGVESLHVVAGIAGGVPSTFFALRRDFIGANMTTAAHEMGHVFGLFHTHKEDDSGLRYNVYSGDFVCDTPTSYSFKSRVTRDCDYTGLRRGLTQDEIEILVKNIMSYSYPACRQTFTPTQIKRMRFVIASSTDLRNAMSGIY